MNLCMHRSSNESDKENVYEIFIFIQTFKPFHVVHWFQKLHKTLSLNNDQDIY